MDLRIEKTYRALYAAFTELLTTYRYEEITVAMLCDAASIRRTTFYKHFADKADYFAFFVDQLQLELSRTVRSSASEEAAGKTAVQDEPQGGTGSEPQGGTGSEPQDAPPATAQHAARDLFRALLDFLLAHETLMDNIFDSSMVGTLAEVICNQLAVAICECYQQDCSLEGRELEAASQFAAGGTFRLLQLWWKSGHATEEELAFVLKANALVVQALGIAAQDQNTK